MTLEIFSIFSCEKQYSPWFPYLLLLRITGLKGKRELKYTLCVKKKGIYSHIILLPTQPLSYK